jgi:hypothetical protein
MTEWFREYPLITYILIYVMITYVYNKVFKTRKLPILKAAGCWCGDAAAVSAWRAAYSAMLGGCDRIDANGTRSLFFSGSKIE